MEKIRWMVSESIWGFVNTLNFSILKKMRVSIKPCKYTFSPSKRAVLKAFSDADIVVSIGGEMLNDYNWKRLPLFLYGYWLGCIMGKTVAIFPQSIGPLNKSFIKLIVRYVLKQCDLVFPRDRISLMNVKKLGVPERKVHLIPDVAVNQPYISPDRAKLLLKKEGVNLDGRPLIGITISKFKESDYQRYFLVIKQLCQFIITTIKGTVVFFSPNMPYRQEISDLSLAQDLHKELPVKENVKVLSNLYSPREFKGMLGELDLFISTRMHASILATMMGTPTITINTQPKLKGYMQMIHQSPWACEVKDFTVEMANKLVEDILANSAQVRTSLEKAKCEVKGRVIMAAKLLRDRYDQKIGGGNLDN